MLLLPLDLRRDDPQRRQKEAVMRFGEREGRVIVQRMRFNFLPRCIQVKVKGKEEDVFWWQVFLQLSYTF